MALDLLFSRNERIASMSFNSRAFMTITHALSATLAALAISSTAYAQRGGGIDGGGGDPQAVQFLQIGRFFAFHQMKSKIAGNDVSAEKIHKHINSLEASLEGKTPRLVFHDGDSVNCFGEPKLGCVSNGTIRIARDGWLKAGLETKIQLAAMEILLLMGFEGRYPRAAKVSKALAPRLVLTDGNIVFPRAAARALQSALKLLNTKGDENRKFVLKVREDNCIEMSWACKVEMDNADNDTWVFTARDIVSVVPVGKGMQYDPCKTDVCEGEDVETSEFLVIVKAASRARWGYGPLPIVLRLEFQRITSQKDGSIRNAIRMYRFDNPTAEDVK